MKKPFLIVLVLLLMGGIGPQVFSQTKENLYFVFLNTNPEREVLHKESVDSLQAGHLKNIIN